MTLILGIYHRGNRLQVADVQPMLDVFGALPYRHLTQRSYPGFLLVSANELADEHHFSNVSTATCAAAVVGTLVVGGNVHARAADGFWEAWQSQQADCLPAAEGAFVAAAYNPQSHSLHLANDKFGMRPVFICAAGEYLAFCNELEPLLRLPGYAFSIDEVAVATYFGLGTTLDGQTFAAGIRNLAPGSFLHVTPDGTTETRYWQAAIAVDHGRSLTQHAAHVAAVLQTIVAELPQQLTHLRCLVSAGADTRLILSCLPPSALGGMSFFTSSLAILPMADDRDVIGAQALAARLGLQHEVAQIAFSELEFGVDYFDRVKRSRDCKVLGGWHGGEYLGGCCNSVAPIRKEPDRAAVDARLQAVFSRRFLRRLAQRPVECYRQAIDSLPAENRDFHFQIQQLGRAFFSTVYQGSRGSWLQPYEIVNQGFSPFWDSRFLQAVLAVPFEWVADYQLYNAIFKDCLPALTDIPSNSPLTLRADSALPPMTAGQDPKVVLQPKYQSALDAYRKDGATWRERRFRWWRMRRSLRDGTALSTLQFIDFEAWRRRYGKWR